MTDPPAKKLRAEKKKRKKKKKKRKIGCQGDYFEIAKERVHRDKKKKSYNQLQGKQAIIHNSIFVLSQETLCISTMTKMWLTCES